jgi:hypothetical protein
MICGNEVGKSREAVIAAFKHRLAASGITLDGLPVVEHLVAGSSTSSQ